MLIVDSKKGLTLIETVLAIAIAAMAAAMLYPLIFMINATSLSNQQKLEADSLAMDRILEVFNTYNFNETLSETILDPLPPPESSLLPDDSEIRTHIRPLLAGDEPYAWEIVVSVARHRLMAGGHKTWLTNDTVYKVTRYRIERN
ncbi:MAG: DUF3237 domain-containing protein [Lentisphaerae bacterium]|nr:DUF3237 domain-containing protein [Lentisphaerota bacterium]